MKKLITIIAIALLIGCNKESICDCTKSYYEWQTTVVFDNNGLPHLQHNKVLLYSEGVTCQDEVESQSTGGSNYFSITCE